jgi:hypothetical protein
VTTADPEPQADKRGRHARRDDPEDDPAPQEEPAEETAPKDEATRAPEPKGATRAAPSEDEPAKRPFRPIGRHPAGVPLLIAAGLVTGISLLPLLFDRLDWSVAREAAANASSAAAPWPAAAEPWFTPGWVAETAFLVSVAVLVLALIGLTLPDVLVLGLAAVLTATTAWAALATLDVLEAGLWELVPLCILCVIAFGLAGIATARWRSDPAFTGNEGAGGVLAAALATWLAVAVVLLAGAAIADSVRTRALGDAPAQGVPGLLAVRATDAPKLEGYRGLWLAQLIRAQVTDDEQGSAYAARHAVSSAGFPTLLVRGDDTGVPDLDDTWWLTLVRQSFGSQADVQAWCSRAGLAPPDCTPLLIS